MISFMVLCLAVFSAASLSSSSRSDALSLIQHLTASSSETPPSWKVESLTQMPVIDEAMARAEGIEDGLEGGRILKDRHGLYHLFPSERMQKGTGIGDGLQPSNLHMRLGHWTSSTPGVPGSWKRVGSIVESTGVYDGTDRMASLFAGMPVFDPQDGKDGRWHFFYVAYAEAPMSKGPLAHQHAYVQFDGGIVHAVSDKEGEDGLDGPYSKVGFVLDPRIPGDQDLTWEGDQGDDAFFPYRLPSGKWVAFYGSALSRKPEWTEENKVFNHDWFVGLAELTESPEGKESFLDQGGHRAASTLGTLGSEWRKMRDVPSNPVMMDPSIENPIVTKTQDGKWYVAVYYPFTTGEVAFSYSKDGLLWSKGTHLRVTPDENGALPCGPGGLLTALGLVPEGDGVYSLMFTGRATSDKNSFENVCYARVRNENEGPVATEERLPGE